MTNPETSKMNLVQSIWDGSKPRVSQTTSGVPTPYPIPRIGASLLTPGVDEFYEEECYIWCRLVENGDDWEIEVGGDQFVGPVPEWWGRDIGEGDCGLGIQWMLTDSHSSSGEVMDWALREGLSPGQEFVVYCTRPEWYRCSYEHEEYDFDNELYVIRREPPTISLRNFERAVTEVFEDIRSWEREASNTRKARWDMTRRMRIQWDRGSTWGTKPWCSVNLVSTLHDPDAPEQHFSHRIASGYSKANDDAEALAKLAEVVAKNRPDLNLDDLPVGRF